MEKIIKLIKVKSQHEYRSLGLLKFKADRVLVTLDMPKDVWDKYKHHFKEVDDG